MNVRPSIDVLGSRRDRGQRGDAARGAVDRVVGQPGPRGVPAAPVERPRRVQVAQAARVDRVGGRLEHDRELRCRAAPARARAAASASCRRTASSSRGKKTKPNGAPASAQLDHHRQTALHVGGIRGRGRRRRRVGRDGCPAPAPCRDAPPGAPRRALRRRARDDAPVTRVARRHAARAQDLRHVGAERRLVVGFRRDVDQLERPRGEAFGEHRGRVARCIRPIPIRGGEHRAHRDA